MRASTILLVALFALGCSSGSGDGGSGGTSGGGGSGAAGGSGATGGGGGGQCPNIAGTWTIESSCEPGQIGQQVTLTQNGCTVTDSEGIEIALGADGSFSFSDQLPDGQPIQCSGTATATTITENCTVSGQSCALILGK